MMTNRFWKTMFYAGMICVLPHSASAQIWESQSHNTLSKVDQTSKFPSSMDWARKVQTDSVDLEFILNQAPHERLGASSATIDLPLPDGGVATFSLAYSPILAPEVLDKNTTIKTFQVIDTTNPYNTGRLDITALGFHAMFSYNGEHVFIDPAKEKDTYHSYYANDYSVKEGGGDPNGLTCNAEEHAENKHFTPFNRKNTSLQTHEKISFGTNLRRYRMAVAATGEYTQYFGGTKSDGLAGIVTAINRLNVIFETELSIRFELVANNEDVVFTDATTDPFTHDDRSTLLGEISGVLDTEIGNSNYDIGHVFGVFGGGIASLGAVCGSRKGRGVSGTSRPDRSSFIRLLAHEVGHQFNAPHSFNGSIGSCETNRSSSGAVEPHSGSTIMSYAGICGSQNLRGGKDTFFHNSSLTFMNDFVENPSRGGSCSTLTPIPNTEPEVQAGPDGVIPISTPFILTGQASDADGDTLTHIWEQLDVGPRNEGPEDFEDDGQRALFRSFQPSASPSRTFPQLERVLAGDYVMGEVFPTQDRDLTFRMTIRDGKGGVTDDERILRVSAAAGPFIVETPASSTVDGGMPHTVIWDVANTTADPVNCDMVNLSLSTDGGGTFAFELAEMTANDGSATIDLPNIDTTAARLKASCTTEPFFAINDANFTITRSVIVNQAPSAVNDVATVEEDSQRVQIDVLTNDSDPEGDILTLASVEAPNANGMVEVSGIMAIYTPEPGFIGTETFEYAVSDGNNNTSSAMVTVTVTPKPNIAPDVADDRLTVDQDSGSTRIDVLSNDRDVDGDTLTLQSLGTPSNSASIQIEDNQVSYTPANEFSGTETFTYTVTDGEGATASGTVTVTVTPKPNTAPNIVNDSSTVNQDSSSTLIDVLSNDTDADGDNLTLQSVSMPSNGGSAQIEGRQISYMPASGFSGTETFTYDVADGEGAVVTGSVTVTVTAAPTPTPTPTPSSTTPLSSGSTGGGGSFGPFLLLLLAIRNGIARRRQRLFSTSEV